MLQVLGDHPWAVYVTAAVLLVLLHEIRNLDLWKNRPRRSKLFVLTKIGIAVSLVMSLMNLMELLRTISMLFFPSFMFVVFVGKLPRNRKVVPLAACCVMVALIVFADHILNWGFEFWVAFAGWWVAFLATYIVAVCYFLKYVRVRLRLPWGGAQWS